MHVPDLYGFQNYLEFGQLIFTSETKVTVK